MTLEAVFKAVDQITPTLKSIEGSTSKMQSTMSNAMGSIGKAMIAGFSVAAVTSAISKFTDFTGKLTDLSAKTGISASGLQTLEMAFKTSGVTLDTVTNAITKMGQKLVGGDKSAVNALNQLGLSAANLKQMAPDQAFTKIADSIALIPNPMERSRLAMDLFGKGGVEVLQGLDGNLAKTREAFEKMGLVLSNDVVAAGDQFGDTIEVMKTQGMAMIGQMLAPMLPALIKVAQGLSNLAQQVVPWLGRAFTSLTVTGNQLQAWFFNFLASMADAGSKVPLLGNALGATADAAAMFRDKAKVANDEIVKWTTEVPKAESAVRKITPVLGNYGESLNKTADAKKKASAEAARAAEATKKFQESVDFFGVRLDAFNSNALQPYAASLSDAAAKADIAEATLPPLASTTKTATAQMENAWRATGLFAHKLEDLKPAAQQAASALGGSFKNIGNVILGALQGGGDVLKSVGSSLGQGLGTDLVTKFGAKITSALGPMLGGAFNAVIPGIGALLGPLVSAIGGKLKSLFGGISPEVQAARKAVDEFEASLAKTLTTTQRQEAGGEKWKTTVIAVRDAFLKVGKSAADAESIVSQLWDTSKPDRARAAMEQINRVLAEVNLEQEILNRAITEYGFTIEELGPKFQAQRLTEQAQRLVEDFAVLTQSGIDVGTVTQRMAEKTNDYLHVALAAGHEVPLAMRPMLEKMVEMGLLTDENGNKMGDLSRVPFSETLTQGFDRVIGAIDRMIQALGGGMEKAARDVDDFTYSVGDSLNRIPRTIDIDVNGRYNGPEGLGGELPSFASGSNGVRDFGRGQLAVLHGRERVQTESQMQTEALSTQAMESRLSSIERLMRNQPRALASALADALAVSGAR